MVHPAQHRNRDVIAAEVLLQAKRADRTHRVYFELVPDCNLRGHNVSRKVIIFRAKLNYFYSFENCCCNADGLAKLQGG